MQYPSIHRLSFQKKYFKKLNFFLRKFLKKQGCRMIFFGIEQLQLFSPSIYRWLTISLKLDDSQNILKSCNEELDEESENLQFPRPDVSFEEIAAVSSSSNQNIPYLDSTMMRSGALCRSAHVLMMQYPNMEFAEALRISASRIYPSMKNM